MCKKCAYLLFLRSKYHSHVCAINKTGKGKHIEEKKICYKDRQIVLPLDRAMLAVTPVLSLYSEQSLIVALHLVNRSFNPTVSSKLKVYNHIIN